MDFDLFESVSFNPYHRLNVCLLYETEGDSLYSFDWS